ncbi:MAG: C45 family peptidase [Clostridia bacterium]|nr:C45 family peptidase [Clostridia bacterium]
MDHVIRRSDQSIRFENGCRTGTGPVRVLDLHGTWKEMGRQYGHLLRPELLDIVSFVEEIISAAPDKRRNAEKIRNMLAGQMPYSLRSFLAGVSETSGLSVEQLCSADAVEYIAGLPACSAMAVWKDYAADKLIFGRNYDYGDSFLRLNRDVITTVFHPADGSLSAAITGYAGEIYAVNGFNEAGLFLELNNGTPSTGQPADPCRVCGTTGLFELLFRADSLDLAEKFFRTTLCDDSYIINVADAAEARSYEWSQTGVKRADQFTPDGLLVSTNHYVHPDWPGPIPDDLHSWNSVTRRAHLLKLAETNKGRIDAVRMKELLDLTLENGGATDELTVYQIVVEPETMFLSLKISGACDWISVDLGSFLRDH